MERKITFGQWEAICMLVTLLTTKVILNYPRVLASIGGPAAWFLNIYYFIIATVVFFIISKLYGRFEGKDLIDIGESIGGKPVKIIVGIIFLVFIIGLTSIYLRTYSEEMAVISLNFSPLSFVMVFFTIGLIFSSYLGLEPIARIQAFVIPIEILFLVTFTIALLPIVDFSNFTPILGTGPMEVFVKGASKLGGFHDLIFLFIITPFIKKGGEFKRIGYKTITISSIMFLLITFIFTGIYPYPSVLEGYIPIYELARMISFGRFLERFESLFIIVWALLGLTYLSIMFYFIIHVFRKTFDLQYQRPLIMPFAILVFYLSFLPERLMNTVNLAVAFRDWAFLVVFCMFVALLIIGRYVGKGKNKEKKEKCSM